MDRYVIKVPAPSSSSGSPNKKGSSRLKQATIESLRVCLMLSFNLPCYTNRNEKQILSQKKHFIIY